MIWSDLARLIVTGGRNYSTPARPYGRFGNAMAILDADSSNNLSQHELWSPLNDMISKNGGKVSVSQVEKTLENLFKLGPSQAIKMVRCLDKNNDGFLTADEEPDFIDYFDFNCKLTYYV